MLNSVLIIPCVLITIITFVLIGLSGKAYFDAKSLAHQLIPADIMDQLHHLAQLPLVTSSNDALASDELIWIARRVGAAYMDSHRYVCINLAINATFAFTMEVPIIIYCLPILVSLVDHSCSRLINPLPPDCTGFLHKCYHLLLKGKPKTSQHSTTHLDLTAWKMTLLSMMYVGVMITIVPAFGSVTVYIICQSFPHEVQRGDISRSIWDAAIAVSIITILDCTTLAAFCTMATLDPLFRAALGLNRVRTHVPIKIKMVTQDFKKQEDRPMSMCSIELQLEPAMQRMGSTSTLKSANDADHSADLPLHFSNEDVEVARRHTVS